MAEGEGVYKGEIFRRRGAFSSPQCALTEGVRNIYISVNENLQRAECRWLYREAYESDCGSNSGREGIWSFVSDFDFVAAFFSFFCVLEVREWVVVKVARLSLNLSGI